MTTHKTTAGIPTPAALKLLKLRRQGMEGPALVAAMGLTADRVEEVLEKLGWPDERAVDRQIRELEEILAGTFNAGPGGPVTGQGVCLRPTRRGRPPRLPRRRRSRS